MNNAELRTEIRRCNILLDQQTTDLARNYFKGKISAYRDILALQAMKG